MHTCDCIIEFIWNRNVSIWLPRARKSSKSEGANSELSGAKAHKCVQIWPSFELIWPHFIVFPVSGWKICSIVQIVLWRSISYPCGFEDSFDNSQGLNADIKTQAV